MQNRVVFTSWGGQFQDDLVTQWVRPAADACDVSLDSRSWSGDYPQLFDKIGRHAIDWDIVHLEGHFVRTDGYSELFDRVGLDFSKSSVDSVQDLRSNAYAVPLLEYGYVLAYRAKNGLAPTQWADLWDFSRFPGPRALRDTPVGNIEIALAAEGIAPRTLYDSRGSSTDSLVKRAIRRLDRLRDSVVWWDTGNKLQSLLASGQTTLAVAWSGRILSAMRDLKCVEFDRCELQFSDSLTLVSTDWLTIPLGAPNVAGARSLLGCMYDHVRASNAHSFEKKQGYTVPVATPLGISMDSLSARVLRLGKSELHRGQRISEEFWSANFRAIQIRWSAWRSGRDSKGQL